MKLTVENSPESNSPGKPGAPSRNSENKAGQSPRSNPVCLEVGVTIRSLPTEAGGLTQPIREDGRTVIVFDNGAVLRSTINMPIGQTVIVSNPSGRDVVCRVVGGRNLPSVKGYVEVEFIEPVNDFWGIHQDFDPVAMATLPVAPLSPPEAPAPATPVPSVSPRAAAPSEVPAKSASVSLGGGPSFEDIAGVVSMPPAAATRESITEPARPGPEKVTKDATDYNLSETAKPTSLANWRVTASELPAEKRAIPATREASAVTSPTLAPSHDFLSQGLMAYDQPSSSSNASNGRMPLIVGVAALALAGVCAVVFFMHRRTAPASVANTAVVSQPSTPEPTAANSAPEPVQGPPEEAAQVATQTQAQPLAVEQAQPPEAAVKPLSAVVKSPATTDSRTESRNIQRQEKNAVVTKQADLSSSRRPAIANLKMGSPSAPKQNLANLSEGTAPIADIASADAVRGTPPAGLLTSAGRTSNPPAPPPSAPVFAAPTPATPAPVSAAKTVRDPKLISSTRVVYPPTAKQSNIQGSVTIFASIDADGEVVSAKALSGPLLLREAAVESVKQWKYSPGLVDGKPAPSQVTVSVEFRLN
jgi:TonB family protein